jgi:thermolysin
MSPTKRAGCAIGIAASVIAWSAARPRTGLAQEPRGSMTIVATSSAQIREWDQRLDRMLRGGDLRERETHQDTLMPGRTHQRANQYYKGVRVFGGDVARQLQSGLTQSVFGTVYEGIDVDPSPAFDEDGARALLESRLGATTDPRAPPELTVLPLDAGGYALAWRLRVVTNRGPRQYFIDARTGSALLDYSDRKSQSAVGRALGVLGDTKKISVRAATGRFQSADGLRPPSIETYDMQGNPARVDSYLFGRANLSSADLGSDADNDWTDAPVDDAHVYAGWTYDYYFKRFGRHGLNNADVRVQSLVHPVHRADVSTYLDEYPDYFVNAFYDGDGIVVYGEGLPPGMTIRDQTWDYLAGSLDVVAHELTHGVTEYTSNLIYRNESGALNEAFSDMMGTSAEFFFQPPGSGPLHADYLLGEDVIRPGGLRSMADPAAFGDPDHYSRRYSGTDDNGGVHTNSGIPNHVFYLAIEGGTNRTSGLTVQGVGPARRDEIEKVFYRAFTQMLPSNATFAVARGATIQAATDLYGAGSAAERAVAAAWTAVGVE